MRLSSRMRKILPSGMTLLVVLGTALPVFHGMAHHGHEEHSPHASLVADGPSFGSEEHAPQLHDRHDYLRFQAAALYTLGAAVLLPVPQVQSAAPRVEAVQVPRSDPPRRLDTARGPPLA